MFTINPATVEAVQATEKSEGTVLITSPEQISGSLNLNQMNALAEKYVGKKFEKGTTKSAACVILFDGIATKLGIAPEVIAAAKKKAEEVAAAKPKAEKKPRKSWSKTYILKTGRKPEEKDGKREVIWGDHADVITEAIAALIAAGKATASREEIMQKAVELGLYDRRKSTQGVNPIFSWWRKPLFEMGWIDVEPKPEKPAEEAKPAAEAPAAAAPPA
jgi:hypothetical protein